MSAFASGKYAIAICDRCGFQYPYNQLRFEISDQKRTGCRVCPECLDEEQPQLQLGQYPVNDPQALRNPRPDLSQDTSRRLFAFDPVGNGGAGGGGNLIAHGQVGIVKVTT